MKCAWVWLGVCLCAWAQNDLQQPNASSRNATSPQASFKDLAQRASSMLDRDPKAAADLCRQALALNPAWAEGWFDLGASEYKLGQFEEAKSAFEKANQLAGEKGAVWAFLGLSEYELHEYSSALGHIVKAETLGLPDNLGFVSAVHNDAARVLIRSKDYSAAVEQMRPLARLNEKSPETIRNFGLSVLGISEVPAGKEGMVTLAGEVEWALARNLNTKAAPPLEALLTRYPKESGVHYLNGLYLVAQDKEGARREFEKELQITPSHVAARLQIAIIDLRLGNTASAAAIAAEAVRLQPDNALAHTVLGRAYMEQNNFAKATQEFQAAAKFAPLNPQVHLYLGQIYSRLGKTQEAEKEKAEFLRLRTLNSSSDSAENSTGGKQ